MLVIVAGRISETVNRPDITLTRHRRFFVALIIAHFCFSSQAAHGIFSEYKLGDIAAEDVVTPVSLVVPNLEATEALKKKVASEVKLVVRFNPQAADEAQVELRGIIAAARANFVSRFQFTSGRVAISADVDTPLFTAVINNLAAELPKGLPLEKVVRLWVLGGSDKELLEGLLKPLRQAMDQPIVAQIDGSISANQALSFVTVRNATDVPAVQELEKLSLPAPSRKIVALWRARRLVETSFPREQEETGRFVASFVRPNAYPDPGLTELLRARRVEGVTANDIYEAAQIILRKGQVVDRKAMSALAVMREKTLIGTLQNKLEQEQTIAAQIGKQTNWIAASLAVVGLALLLILSRLRARPSTELVPVISSQQRSELQPVTATELEWQQRALVAEARVERAHGAIRSGALSWMREVFFRTLFRHRTELLSVQQKAEMEMRELEQRLEQLHAPLQERIDAYEKRIEELEKDLAAKGEENRQLIGARISVAKQQLILERKRGRFGTN